MNAVLAIIADGGRAIIVINREAVEINYFLVYFIDSTKFLPPPPRPTPLEEGWRVRSGVSIDPTP